MISPLVDPTPLHAVAALAAGALVLSAVALVELTVALYHRERA